jgi:perosamine synthetase
MSRVTAASLGRALRRADIDATRQMLAQRFDARAVALADSGTSALVMALRTVLPSHGTVALPAYACVDLLAACAHVGAQIRFYDVDPATLSPDLDSVERALERGAHAIIVAHLFGFPADVPAVARLAASAGAVVIEDAAQQAAGTLNGTPLGAQGPLVVLSFGRGKGMTAGNGGALLARDPKYANWVDVWEATNPARRSRGWRDWTVAAAMWAIGRPSLYGIPASIPALRLGETVYKEAHEPGRLSFAAAGLLAGALASADDDRAMRERNACALADRLSGTPGLSIVHSIAGGSSGYLRLPVLDDGRRAAAPRLGVVRCYPRPLPEEPAAQQLLRPQERIDTPGARVICERLFSLPTHASVTDADRAQLTEWARKVRSP